MQRWRLIRNIALALVLLGAPARLNAQPPANKDTATNPTPTAGALKAQAPQQMQSGKPKQPALEPLSRQIIQRLERRGYPAPRPRKRSSILHF